jgi:hypothetical protein
MAGASNPAFATAAGSAMPSAGGGKGGGQAAVAPGPSTVTQSAPAQMATSGQPNVFNQSAGAYNAALGGTQGAAMGQGPNIAQFMNPYQQMVTGQTLQDLERQRQMQMNTIGQQASQAGAFGGSRQGVAEALTNEGFARQGAQAFGNLQQQGFNTALGAAQQQQQTQLNAANQMGQLANLGFGFGTQLNQQQAQQGALQQGLQQMLIDAAKGQYGGFTGAPGQALNLPLAAVGAANMGQRSETQSYKPGLFDYLNTFAGMIPKGPAG